jgi:hypothetical protein
MSRHILSLSHEQLTAFDLESIHLSRDTLSPQ